MFVFLRLSSHSHFVSLSLHAPDLSHSLYPFFFPSLASLLQIIADFAQAFEKTGKANGGWEDANGDAVEAKEVVPKAEHPVV